MTGKGIESTLTQKTNDSSQGAYTVKFTEVQEGANKCKTGTEPAGIVVISGEDREVTISEAPLTIGTLFLLPAMTVACGTTEKPEKIKIKAEGAILASFTGELNKDIATASGALKGSKGKQEKTAYLDDAGETINASFKVNFGLGAEGSNVNVAEVITMTSEPDATVDG
jgi:hypothetical protein